MFGCRNILTYVISTTIWNIATWMETLVTKKPLQNFFHISIGTQLTRKFAESSEEEPWKFIFAFWEC